MREAVVVEAVRTAVGKRGGVLSDTHPAGRFSPLGGGTANATLVELVR
jgi:hypothetical protein